jgi:hypothetical protein
LRYVRKFAPAPLIRLAAPPRSTSPTRGEGQRALDFVRVDESYARAFGGEIFAGEGRFARAVRAGDDDEVGHGSVSEFRLSLHLNIVTLHAGERHDMRRLRLTAIGRTKKPSEASNRLYRYTNLASMLYLLRNGSLTLLNYRLWDDRNDQYCMDYYREQGGFGAVLAACFTMAPERYHHWRVFAPGADGVRIHFEKDVLVDAVKNHEGVRCGNVKYVTIDQSGLKKFSSKKAPFLKRVPYKDEQEFRVLWSGDGNDEMRDIAIPQRAVTRVTLSPWLPPALEEVIRESVRAIPGYEDIQIPASTLRDSKRWKEMFSLPSAK